jgi:hypothetical protein
MLMSDGDNIGDEGVKLFAKGNWNFLSELDLSSSSQNLERCSAGDEGIAHIVRAYWPSLTRLALTNNPIRVEGL